MRKKLIIILVGIFVISLLSIVGIKSFHNIEIKKDIFLNDEREFTNQFDNKKIDKEKNSDITEQFSQEEQKKSSEEKVLEKENKANNKIDSEVSNKNTSSTSSKTENKKSNNQNKSNPKDEIPKQSSPKQEKQPVPSCTPKKFDMNFVRADFSSFTSCTQMGDKYKNIGYGYFCDSYQDDCGTTYYMLTIYESNTGINYDFHTIQLP